MYTGRTPMYSLATHLQHELDEELSETEIVILEQGLATDQPQEEDTSQPVEDEIETVLPIMGDGEGRG